MLYRKLPHGDEKISIIGMGTSVVGEQEEKDIIATFEHAAEKGINYFDFAGGHASIFPAAGIAFEKIRKDVMLQVHFGADYTSGEYGWNPTLEGVEKSIEWQLKNLRTDYIDFGFIHCLDEDGDVDKFIGNGVLDYLLGLKKQGVVKHIGLSTHNPAIGNKILDMHIIDMMMFSINPMYDYGQGDYAMGGGNERYEMYNRCEKEGVGISVMKPFNGGQLLDAKQSPFGKAMTPAQCIQYALDRPAVLTVMQGSGNIKELDENLEFLNATEEEKDYSLIGSFTPDETKGRCVYCKHCHPCPAGIDIGMVNKFYDLAKLGDELAVQHYLGLEKTASDCLDCGHCDSRCPFHVHQSARMKEIKEYFGK